MDLASERRRRILTTHVGSLPRPDALSAKLLARMTGQPFDAAALAKELARDVGAIVAKQAELGIDVVSDGEFSKTSFQYYVTDRLSGLEPITPKPGVRTTRENRAFPVFYKGGAHAGTQATRYACTGPIRYVGQAQLAADIANFKAALARRGPCRRLHAVGVAVELRRPDGEPPLQERRGARLRRRRGAARGISRHRRRRLHAADRRSAARHVLHALAGRERRSGPRLGGSGASRRSIMRCATFRPSGCAITPATASTWARAPATSSSSTSPISS